MIHGTAWWTQTDCRDSSATHKRTCYFCVSCHAESITATDERSSITDGTTARKTLPVVAPAMIAIPAATQLKKVESRARRIAVCRRDFSFLLSSVVTARPHRVPLFSRAFFIWWPRLPNDIVPMGRFTFLAHEKMSTSAIINPTACTGLVSHLTTPGSILSDYRGLLW